MEAAPSQNRPAGLNELLSSGALDAPNSNAFERIAWLAAEILHVPVVMVSLMWGERNWLYSSEICDENLLVQALLTVEKNNDLNDILSLSDTRVDPDCFDVPCFEGQGGFRFFAAAPVRSPSQEICGHVILAGQEPRLLTSKERNVFRCISDQVESELRLMLLMQEEVSLRFAATRAFNAKSAFLSLISHEIRTPIAGIMGATDMLLASRSENSETQDFSEKQQSRDMLRTIRSSASDLLQLLNETLDTAKIEADGVSIQKQAVDMVEFTEKLRGHFKPLTDVKQLDLTISFSGGEEHLERILTDPTRLRQILYNLMHNAIKFTETGEVMCRMEVVPADRQKNKFDLKMIISDTGIGMDEADLATIFEPFSQLDSGESRTYGGTGLGMSLVKQLVGKMDGSIEVTSKVGLGTRVSVTLPTAEYEQDEWILTTRPFDEDAKTIELESLEASDLKGLQVLVADDNSQNRFILSKVLQSWGCDPILAECGETAFELAKQHSFDAIILDLHMPRKTGFDVARDIRQYTSSTRLIACSADTTQSAYAMCQDAGFDDILSKPFEWNAMHQSLLKSVKQIAS